MAKSSKKHIQFLSPENYIRQKARNLPIYKCLINTNWQREGLAQIAIARQHTNGNLTFGLYMVDLFCLGVRDTFYGFNRPETEFDDLVSKMTDGLEMTSVDYVLIHNIIYAAIEYAEELGFNPHKDYKSITQYILEEDTDEIALMEIECGKNGKPLFIKSDFISEAQSKSIINQLEKAVGPGNYDVISGYLYDDEEEEDFDSDIERERYYSKKKSDKAFQFKIQLANINNPLVWRRILMPSNATFEDFHDAIQIAFGWEDYHLFMFSPKGFGSSPVIELKNEEDDFDNPFSRSREEKLDAETLTLSEIFNNEKQTFTYIYDFGDNWEHKITLEAILHQSIDTPLLLKGKGACPPEDCGSAWGYENLKVVMADKKHPEHKEMREWLGLERGENWDAEEFDLQSHQEDMEYFFSDEP